MKQQPTREQVLDAMQTHKSVQKAANALGIKYPEMQKWLRKYGIVVNHNAKAEPEEKVRLIKDLMRIPTQQEIEDRSARAKALYEQQKAEQERKQPWYKRFFRKKV